MLHTTNQLPINQVLVQVYHFYNLLILGLIIESIKNRVYIDVVATGN